MRREQPAVRNGRDRTTLVAVGELLLWPQSVGHGVVTREEAGGWPAFALFVGERRDLLTSRARLLFDLLEEVRRSAEPVVMTGRWGWTVVDPVKALLRISLQVQDPASFDVDVLVPAERLLGLLPVVARGAPIGLTTRRHAHDLGGCVDVRAVLRRSVLVRGQPVPGLAELADELIWSMPSRHGDAFARARRADPPLRLPRHRPPEGRRR